MAARSNEAPFVVRIITQEVVTAAQPALEPGIVLSNLDWMLPPIDISVFFSYKKNPDTPLFECAVANLKRSLSDVLGPFYAFAGEVVNGPSDDLELVCNNHGVEFAVACANVELRDLDFHQADKMLGKGLVPSKKAGVLACQVTELKCGGIVVSCTFDHRVADAYSANMFLVSWAESASSKPISTVPSFSRSPLQPRYPLNPDLADEMYAPLSLLPHFKRHNCLEHEWSQLLTNSFYYVAATDIQRIQDLANHDSSASSGVTNNQRRTKLESFAAYLWKMLAGCTDAKRYNLAVVVDGRSRLVDLGSQDAALSPPMSSYFGNVLSVPLGTLPTLKLKETCLARVAEEVHGVVRSGATSDHFHALIDWLESRRLDSGVSKVLCYCGGDDASFLVSSGLRFPFADVDFGWGRPVFGSYYCPQGSTITYVMPILGPLGNGDWVVYVIADQVWLKAMQVETGNILHPVTAEYLGLEP